MMTLIKALFRKTEPESIDRAKTFMCGYEAGFNAAASDFASQIIAQGGSIERLEDGSALIRFIRQDRVGNDNVIH